MFTSRTSRAPSKVYSSRRAGCRQRGGSPFSAPRCALHSSTMQRKGRAPPKAADVTSDPSPVKADNRFRLACAWAAVLVLVTGAAEMSASTAYGKFGTESAFSLPPRVGWWLMELPVTVSFLVSFFCLPGKQKHHLAPRICAAVMCLHYSYRGWLYPYLLRPHPGARSNFSLLPAVGGWMVTVTHGCLNGRWFAEHGDHLTNSWLRSFRFRFGLLVYLTGFASLVYHDHLMRELRSSPGPRYRIPHGGLFEYATQAVYFCELLTWHHARVGPKSVFEGGVDGFGLGSSTGV
ncbi:unnamed protein product [Effrenium voratum]|nr:unnamed protein product [Effrenium voratum]